MVKNYFSQVKVYMPSNDTEAVFFLTENEKAYPNMGVNYTPKVGCFFKIVKIQLFCCFITQLVKNLQQWSLYVVIEDILPFVLNTKRPLSNIWFLRSKKNNFGCLIFSKTPNTVSLITQQPNIAQRPFCIQNNRQGILYHLI